MSRKIDPNRTRARVRQILLCGALAGCIQALPPEAVAAERGEDLSRWTEAPPMKQAIAAARKYWTAREPGFQEDVRVLDTTTGAFTRPGIEQRAVLFRMSTHPRGFPKKGLAILEGDELVRNIAMVLLAENVDAYRNFDGSGRDAFALEGGFGMGGQYTRGETIAAFEEEGLVELGRVDTYNDICGTGRPDAPGPTSATITVAPGKGFMIQRFRKATCESESKREPVGEPEPLVLKPDARNPFEDIPVAAATRASKPETNPDALLRRALEAEDRGQLEQAIELHEQVVAARPNEVRSLNSIAGLYGTLGRYREETAWAKKATEVDPSFAPAWVNLGTGHLALGEKPQAVAAYSRAVAVAPRYPVAHFHLGLAQEATGRLAEAEASYESAVKADPSFEPAYLNLGALCANQGRFDDATAWLQRLLEIDPSNADARGMLAQIERRAPGQAGQAPAGGPAQPAQPTSFAAGQVWKGQYTCGQGETQLALQITEVRGPRVTAIFDFFHAQSQAEGQFYIYGEYQRETRQIAFAGGEWIKRPPGYVTVGLLGHLDSGERVLAGVVDAPGCGEFVVKR